MSDIILGGFLWAPSEKYWDDILNIIDKRYGLIHVKKYKFGSTYDLEKVILKLYENDNVPLEKIKKVKVKQLKKYDPVCINFYFQVKKNDVNMHNNKISVPDVIDMKREIRRKYRDNIQNYKRDIIIHISDNPKQTSFVDNLIENYIRKKN